MGRRREGFGKGLEGKERVLERERMREKKRRPWPPWEELERGLVLVREKRRGERLEKSL